MKTLNQIIREIYEPNNKGEAEFIAKHVIQKIPDRNGNGDDVFKASKVKTYKRKPKHGYDPPEDKKVHEDHDESRREMYLKHHGKAIEILQSLIKHLEGHKADLEKHKDKKDFFVRHPHEMMKDYSRRFEDLHDQVIDQFTTKMPEPRKIKPSALVSPMKNMGGTKYDNF